jgi:hypothetical protein
MDKKVIKALTNFGEAIDTLVEELKKQSEEKTETKSIFSSIFGKNTISKQLNKIQNGIKSIAKDTKTIIKNQQEIIKLSKKNRQQQETGLFEKAGDKKQIDKIKEGVGSIILIAAGVMAIGLALKIVSPVDLVTALALSVAVTAIGFTMAKLMEAGVPKPQEALMIGLSLLMFSGAVVGSAFLISLIPQIKPAQFLTFLGISATFALMFKLGMDDAIKATSKIKPQQIIFLPMILLGISAAVMLSSFILSEVQPINAGKLLNILAMGVTLAVLALVMSVPIWLIGKMGGSLLKGALLSVIIFPAMSLAVMLSSYLISMGDYSQPLPIDWALSFGLGMLILAFPVAILGMIPLPMVLSGALSLVIISAAIVAASHILSYINQDFLLNIADGIAYFVDVVGGAIIRFASQILPIIVKIASEFLTAVLPPFAQFLKEILPPLGDFLSKILKDLLPMVKEILGVVKTVITEIDDIILAISKVLDSIGNIIDKVGGVFEIVGDKIIGILGGIKDIISTVADSIVKVFNGVTDSIVRLSQVDGTNLLTVGAGLASIGFGLTALTGGTLVKAIGDFFSGGGISEQLKDLSQFHQEIYKTGKGVEMLAEGLDTLNNVELEDEQVAKVLNVLERVGKMNAQASLETVNRQVLDGTNLVQQLENLTGNDNEELLQEMRLMNQQLSVIVSNSSSISSQLNSLREDKEPNIEF